VDLATAAGGAAGSARPVRDCAKTTNGSALEGKGEDAGTRVALREEASGTGNRCVAERRTDRGAYTRFVSPPAPVPTEAAGPDKGTLCCADMRAARRARRAASAVVAVAAAAPSTGAAVFSDPERREPRLAVLREVKMGGLGVGVDAIPAAANEPWSYKGPRSLYSSNAPNAETSGWFMKLPEANADADRG
jgi:hypothetical protein